jgi:diacylglycerol kinase
VSNKKIHGKSGAFSFTARWRSLSHAMNGLRYLVRNEHNARIHFVCTVGVVLAGGWLQLSAADWRWVMLVIAWVWFGEAINTAVEYVCDVVSPDCRRSIESAKDVAAGAVLISVLAAMVIGCLTFWPYVLC